MITLTSISRDRLGLSAEERMELKRLRGREAKHKAEIEAVRLECTDRISQLEAKIVDLTNEFHQVMNVASNSKYYKANEYQEYITNDMYVYTQTENKY